MSPGQFPWKFRLAETIPVLIAIPCALIFFSEAISFAREYIRFYLILSVVLFLITRVPGDIYVRTRILPSVKKFLLLRQQGRIPPQEDLRKFYLDFANFVPRCQAMAFILWLMAGIGFLVGCLIWIPQHRTSNMVIALLVAVALTMCLSLFFSYLTFKSLIRPLIVETMKSLETLPAKGVFRVPFRIKLGVSTLSMMVLGFLVFGLIISNRVAEKMNLYALDLGQKEAREFPGRLALAPGSQYDELITEWSVGGQIFMLVDNRGELVGAANRELYSDEAKYSLRDALQKEQPDDLVHTPDGLVRILPVAENLYLIQMVERESIKDLKKNFLLAIFAFIGIIFLVVGSYIVWLTSDTAWILKQTSKYNKCLAEGDLTQTPAIWADDEMGEMADSLRMTFQGLTRMAREVFRASSVVEEEVQRVVHTSQNLHSEVAKQTGSVEDTSASVHSLEEAITRVSTSMSKVANSTQEMSSTILEMQASVEEIASNADILIMSVEQTVSSSNQISASSEEISGSTDQLHQNSQEAVSFLTQLDAALDETQQNAKSLSDASTKVTLDAEGGFTAVAAVEEQILRTRSASEESKEALAGLTHAIERIGKIVGVIQEITEQTNLLSLNASIIAAGAGEYGKSFAVVATQIRELSAKTAGNAKEIRAVIRSIRESGDNISASIDKTFDVADKGTVLSKKAGESLKTILESSSAQEEMSKRIASATAELAHGGESASRTMHRIFSMIQGISKASEEQVRATRLLNRESEKVREVALQLRNATDEQAKGSRVISQAINRITQDSQETSRVMQAQARDSRAITESMNLLASAAQNIEEVFQALTQASTRLQQSAVTLNQEVRAFRLPSGSINS